MTTDLLSAALLRTKLYRPPLPTDWVPRQRLLDQLRRQQQRPLTLVSAPAGFGKSTLISAWLEQCEWRSAWLSLDEGDDDLATFLSYVVTALRTVFPEFGTATGALLNTVSAPPLSVIVSSFSNDLTEIDEPFLLALDDYHVIHNPAIHDLLSRLLNNPPPAFHLALAGRRDPPLPIASLRAQAAVSEIRSSDLRFTVTEALAFLHQTLGPQIDEGQAALLNHKTEGWVAGLRLAALSTSHQRAENRVAVDTTDIYLMDYLASEVLAQQPVDLQEFLIKTSILERLHGSLCEAVVQGSEPAAPGQTYLTRLEELNLFITPLDDRREWFRYHPLFRQLLQHQLERRYPRSEIATLHRLASRWLAAHDLLEEAVQHALLAGEAASAAQIVAQRRYTLMNQDDWRRLEVLLHTLPPAIVETEPELLLAKAWLAYNQFKLLQMPAVIDRAETLIAQQALAPAVKQALQGEIAFFRCYQAYWANDLAGIQSNSQQALNDLPLDGWFARLLSRLFLASAHHMLGDPACAASILSAGFAEAQTNGPYLVRSFLIKGFIHWYAGDLQAITDAADRVLALSEQQHHSQTVNWAHYFKGIVYYHRNQLAEAEQHLSAVVLDRYHTHMQCLMHGAIALAFTYQAQQQPARAQAVAEMITAFVHETGNTTLLPVLHAFQASLVLKQDRLADASQWAAQAQPPMLGLSPHFFAHEPVWPRVQLALDMPASRLAAAEPLARLGAFAESRHHTHVLLEVLLDQALLYETQGQHPAVLAALERALELAQPGGFTRLFLERGAAMQALLHQVLDRGVAPHFVAQILAAFAPPNRSSRVSRSSR